MAGILANSATVTMTSGTPDASVTGYLVGERITLTTNPTGSNYLWSIAKPGGSSIAAATLNGSDGYIYLVPDVEGYYTVTVTVDTTTTYVLRIAAQAIGEVNYQSVSNYSPLANTQVPTPTLGGNLYYSSTVDGVAYKKSDGSVISLLSANVGDGTITTAKLADNAVTAAKLDTKAAGYATYAEARAAITSGAIVAGDRVRVHGRTAMGDGGQGWFDCVNASATDNGGTLLTAGGGTSSPHLKRDFDSGCVEMQWFGVSASETAANNATYGQSAIDYASTNGFGVHLGATAISLTKWRIKNGLKYLKTEGSLITGTSGTPESIIELDGNFFSTTAVSDCVIDNLNLDCNSVARGGIFAATAIRCKFTNIKVTNPEATDRFGIRFHNSCVDNVIDKFDITLQSNVTSSGIQLTGTAVDSTGGYMANGNGGGFTAASQWCERNKITNGIVRNGSHGIALFASRRNQVSNVLCTGQRDRGIILAPQASENKIADCQMIDFGSTGIHIAYDSNNNEIANVTCDSSASTGESGLQAYVGCTGNTFTDCVVRCTSHYGVYFAIGAKNNTARNIKVDGSLTTLAAFAVESDWKTPLPGGATYSRPNYGAPTAPRTVWPDTDSTDNVFDGCTVTGAGTGKGVIYLGQVGATFKVERNRFNNIRSISLDGGATLPSHELFVFEETTSKAINNEITNCDFASVVTSKISFTRDRSHFSRVENNYILNRNYYFDDAPANSATPSVAKCDKISTAGYSSNTNVTDFTGGIDGQTIIVRMSSFTTLVHNNSVMRLRGNSNIVGSNTNDFVTLTRHSGIWFEVSRTAA